MKANSNHREILKHSSSSNDNSTDFFDINDDDDDNSVGLDLDLAIYAQKGIIGSFLRWQRKSCTGRDITGEMLQQSWIDFSDQLDDFHKTKEIKESRRVFMSWFFGVSLLVILLVFGIVELVNMNSNSDLVSLFKNTKEDTTLLESIQLLHSHDNSMTSVYNHKGTEHDVSLGSNASESTVASAAAAATNNESSVTDVMVQTEMTMVTMNKTMGGESSLPSSLVEPEDERINIVTKTCAINNIMFGGDGYRDCHDLCLEVGCCVVHVDDGEERLDCEIANDVDVMSACVPYLSCANINDVRPPSLP